MLLLSDSVLRLMMSSRNAFLRPPIVVGRVHQQEQARNTKKKEPKI